MLVGISYRGVFYRPPLGKNWLGRDKLPSACCSSGDNFSFLFACSMVSLFFSKFLLRNSSLMTTLYPLPPYRLKYLYGLTLKASTFLWETRESLVVETAPGECSGDIIVSLDFPPNGNRCFQCFQIKARKN